MRSGPSLPRLKLESVIFFKKNFFLPASSNWLQVHLCVTFSDPFSAFSGLPCQLPVPVMSLIDHLRQSQQPYETR